MEPFTQEQFVESDEGTWRQVDVTDAINMALGLADKKVSIAMAVSPLQCSGTNAEIKVGSNEGGEPPYLFMEPSEANCT